MKRISHWGWLSYAALFSIIAYIFSPLVEPTDAAALKRLRVDDLRAIAKIYSQYGPESVVVQFPALDFPQPGMLAEGGSGTDFRGQISYTSMVNEDRIYFVLNTYTDGVYDEPLLSVPLDGASQATPVPGTPVGGGSTYQQLFTGGDGNVYGLTFDVSTQQSAVFDITEDGEFHSIYAFPSNMRVGSLFRWNGSLYVVASIVGSDNLWHPYLYQILSSGTLGTGIDLNGVYPKLPLAAADGNLYYLVNVFGGDHLYQLTPSFTDSYVFTPELVENMVDGADGAFYIESSYNTTLEFYRQPYVGTEQAIVVPGLASSTGLSFLGTDGNVYGYTEPLPTGPITSISPWAAVFRVSGANPGVVFTYNPAVVGSLTEELMQGANGSVYGLSGGDGTAANPGSLFRLDMGLPSRYKIHSSASSTSSTPGRNGWMTGPASITLSGTSKPISYAVDSGAGQTYSGPFTVSGDGKHIIKYCSTDSPPASSEVDIDSTPPTTAAQLSGPLSSGSTYSGPVTVTLSATDALSGVASTTYQVDGGASTMYQAAFTVSTLGQHTISYQSADVAGNVEKANTTTFTIGSPPAAPTNLTASAGDGRISLQWSASTGASSYDVYEGTSAGGENATPVSTGITGTTTSVAGLTNGTTYYFTVAGVNASGAGPVSNEASAVPAPPISYPAGLQFMSSPIDYSSTSSLDTLFGVTGVKLATWDPVGYGYDITPTPPADKLHIGIGYWIRLANAVTLNGSGTPADVTKNYTIQLSQGWNAVGDPFFSTVGTSTLTFNGLPLTQADSGPNPLVASTIWAYSSVNNNYFPAVSIAPKQGYWIYAYSNCTLSIPHP